MKYLPLTKSQIADLERRGKEALDPRRWVVYSKLIPRLPKSKWLYYCVDSHAYTIGVKGCTLFKNKQVALSVAKTLSNLRKDKTRDPLKVLMIDTSIRK